MRTTIDLPDRLRARLLELAARRGEKGFSGLIEKAVVRYLDELDRREAAAREARSTIGSLSEDEADALEETVHRLRANWR